VSWSRQNRSQLIRIPAAEGEQARIEVRSPDSSCNQYLVMALIIAAGLDGIEKNLPLSPAVDLDLYTASEKDLEGLEKLPGSLEEARSIAKDSTFVRSVIPETTLLSFLEGNNSNGFRLDE
jgi:glutamine synthetase